MNLKQLLPSILQDTDKYDSLCIVGNLPFAQASVLLQEVLQVLDLCAGPSSMVPAKASLVLMFQKEVAQVRLLCPSA